VNIHASLLPRWRGAAPIQRAILAGDAQTGVSIMKMDVGLDTGPVYSAKVIGILPGDTAGSLHDRLASMGGAALMEVLRQLAEGSARSTPQREDGVTYAAKIDKAEATIDWSRSATDIERQVRAFNPWPIAETRLEGEQLRIYGAKAEGASTSLAPGHVNPDEFPSFPPEPGTITAIRDNSILVACGEGSLALTELQRPGRRPVAARDLINTLDLLGCHLG
jgi:methionyl-tRNA formyltransferase